VCVKFLTKLAANRLQGKILDCIHKNQYGFLRNRSIQDCLAWAFEYIYLCHASKRPIVILKLDFAKAFDTVEHEAIIQVTRHKGFNHSFKNRTGDRTGEAVGSGFYRSNHWFTGSLSGFLIYKEIFYYYK
jgi:hypothetical protein